MRLPAPSRLAWLALPLAGCASALAVPPRSLQPAEAIVVLGNRPPVDEGGQVAPETARRVRRGVELFHDGLAPALVMTGGPAPRGFVEAEVMQDYAIALGVSAASIRTEPRSRDTIGNARRTVELLCEGRPAPCQPDLIVVSSPYHLKRAGRLFECAGARVQLAPTEIPDSASYRVGFVAREYLVRAYYALFLEPCARARGEEATETYPGRY